MVRKRIDLSGGFKMILARGNGFILVLGRMSQQRSAMDLPGVPGHNGESWSVLC
jgi:hypothetical protein